MSVTAIGSKHPGGEKKASHQAEKATAPADFLDVLRGGSLPAKTQNAKSAAGPVTGKLLSLLPDVEQGTETDQKVTAANNGAPESVPAAMAMAAGASAPGADSRAMGAPASSTSVDAVEASGPSLPITALPSHVLGTDLAASGATPSISVEGSPVDAAVPTATPVLQSGTAPLVAPALVLEPVDPATVTAPQLNVDAPATTPAPATDPSLSVAGADEIVSALPTGPPVAVDENPSDAPTPLVDTPVATNDAPMPIATAPAPAAPPAPAQATPNATPGAPLPLSDPMAIIRQVADAMQLSIRRGEDVVRVQLRPAELGTVVIHLVQRDGVLHAHVRADSQDAVQALQDSLTGLADALSAQGQSLGGLDVALRQSGDDGAFAAAGGSPRTPHDDVGSDDTTPLSALPPATPSTTAIDFRA